MHAFLPLLRIVIGDLGADLVEQVALAIALVDRTEIPAMAVVVGELGIFQCRIEQGDILGKLRIAPLAADRRFLGIAVEDLAHFFGIGILLLRGPHGGGIRLVIPHRVAEHRVDEHVRLMHVTDHALTGWNLAGELVLERMSGYILRNSRIDLLTGTHVAELGVDRRVARITIVGVDHMATAAAGRAEITRIVVGAEHPQERVVESGLGDVEDRNRDATAGAWATVRLLDVGPAGFFKALDLAGFVGQADFGKQVADVAATAFEHTEDVARRCGFPARQRTDLGQDAVGIHARVIGDAIAHADCVAVAIVGLAED